MDFPSSYTLIYSRRRTLSLQVNPQGEVVVRAPQGCPEAQIQSFVERHAGWLSAHLARQAQWAQTHPELSPAEAAALLERAQRELPARVAYYGARMGLTPAGVRITGARTRFGSCSAKNRLCFSWRLMQYPPEAVDYVVVHELAHLVHKNHQAPFYALVASILPDWPARQKLLRQ